MSPHYHWLPDLELLSAHGGAWQAYLDAIYAHFEADFVKSTPSFRGTKLALKRHPVEHGKEATFWHLVSEGPDEATRTIAIPRCERIRWPKPSIDQCDSAGIHVWEEKRGSEVRIHIYLEHEPYLIVLAVRKGYLLPWTAYPVDRQHQRLKLLKRAAEAQNPTP